MRILGIIPARGGSKGITKKNIRLLGGKPLLAYTAEIALNCAYLSEVILSSDDPEIIKVGEALQLKIPFIRPEELALDHTSSIDVIIHALKWYESNGIFFDAVCLLQPTSPFRTISFLNNAILKFMEDDCDSLISVQKVPHEYNPHWTYEVNEKGSLKIATGEQKIIGRRQDLPLAYHRDGNLYLTKTTVLLQQYSLYGDNISFIESPPELYVNIDTLEDWEKAEKIINRKSI